MREAARVFDADVLLTGILPTLRRDDLSFSNMAPAGRYRQMNDVITKMRGRVFSVHIDGIDGVIQGEAGEVELRGWTSLEISATEHLRELIHHLRID